MSFEKKIAEELYRSACEDREPAAQSKYSAFLYAIDYWGDTPGNGSALYAADDDDVRTFFLLIAEAIYGDEKN